MSKIELTCEFCEKVFYRFKSQIVGKRNVCSRKCANSIRLQHIYECEICHKVFHKPQKIGVKARFCSQKCRGIGLTAPPNTKCVVCYKEFHVSKWQVDRGEGKYCSRDCKSKAQTCSFLGIKAVHYYGNSAWRKLRLEILDRDNYQCLNCGIKPGDKSQLQVNHIVFRELGGSDDPSNLETLCKSCHAKKDALRLKQLTGNDKARMRDYKQHLDEIKSLL
jgi:hypothetical protein